MCRCCCRQLTDEQMCPTLATDSLQRLRKRRKTIPVFLLLLVTLCVNVNIVSSVCVWQGGGSFRLACGFRQSGLFRIRSLGGLKGYVGAGFTVGDEDGFKDSMTNTEGKTQQQQQLQQQQAQGQYYGQQQRISTGHQSHVNFPHQLQGQYSEMDVEKVSGKDYHRNNQHSQLITHNANANVNQLSQAEVLALQQQQTELLLLQQLQQQQVQMQHNQEQAKSALPAATLMAPTPTSSPHNDDPSRNGLTKRASLWRWPKLPIFGGNSNDNRNHKNPHHRGKTGRGPPMRQGPIYNQNQQQQHNQQQHNQQQHQQQQHNQQQQYNQQQHQQQQMQGPPQRGPGPRRPNIQRPFGEQYHVGGKQRPGGFSQRGPPRQNHVNYRRGPAASHSNNFNSISPSAEGPIPLPSQQSPNQYSSAPMKRPTQFGFGAEEGNLPEFKGIPKEYFEQSDYNEQDPNAPEEEEQQYLDAEGKPYGLKMLQDTNNYGSAYQLMNSQPKVPPYLEESGSENMPNSYDNTQGMDPGFGTLSGYDMNDPALATAGYDPNIFPDIYFTTTEKENDKHIHRVLNGHFGDPTAHLQEPSVVEQEPEIVIEEAVVEKPKVKRIRVIKGGKRRKKKRRRKLRVNNSTLNDNEITPEPEQISEQIPEESSTSNQIIPASAETTTTIKSTSTEMVNAASSSTERLEPAPASLPLTSTSPDYGPNFVDERLLPFNIESYYYEESKHEVPPPPPPKPPTKYANDWLTKPDNSFNTPSYSTPDPSSGYDPRYPPNHEVNRGKIPTKFLRSTTTTPRPFFTEDTHYNPSTHFNKTRFSNPNQIPVTERNDVLQFVPFGSGENLNVYDKTRKYNDKFYSHFNKSIAPSPVTGNFYSNPGYYNPQFSFDTDNGKLRGINTSPRPFGPPSDFNPEEIILPWEKKIADPTPIVMNLNGGNRMRKPPGPVFPGSNIMDIDQDPGFVKPNSNLDIFNSPTMETFGLPRKPTSPPNRPKYPDESEERSDTFTINELRKKTLSDINNNANSESDTPNFWGKIQELDRFGPSSDFVTNDNFKVPVDRILSTEAPPIPQPPTTPSPSLSTTSSSVRWTKSRRRMRTKPTTTSTTEMPPAESSINAATMVPPKNSPSPWNNFEDNGKVFSGMGVQVASKNVAIAQSVNEEGLWAGDTHKLPVLTTNEDKTIFQLHNSDHQENMYVGNVMSSTTMPPTTTGDPTKKPKWRRRKPGSRPNVRIKFKGASAEQQETDKEQDKNSQEQTSEKENNSFSQNFFDMNSVTSENSVDSVSNPNPFAKFENVEMNSGGSNSGEGFMSKNEFLDIASTIKKLTKQNKKKFSQNVHVDSSEEKSQSTGEGEGSISPAPQPGNMPSMPNIVPSPPDPFHYENSQGTRFNFPPQSYAPPQPPSKNFAPPQTPSQSFAPPQAPSQSFAPPQPPSPSQSQFNRPWGIPTAKYELPSLLPFHSTTASSFPRKPVDLNTIDYSTSTENSRQIKVDEDNNLEYPGPGGNGHHGGDLHDELESLNQELEDLISPRPSTRRPSEHYYNNNGFKNIALPDALPVQNMFPPPQLPPPFAMDSGPSIKIIKPNAFDDSRGAESEPNRYEKHIPSQKFKATTPTPVKPTLPPQKNNYFPNGNTFPSPGNHYDGSKIKIHSKGDNKNNNGQFNINAQKDKDKKPEFGSQPMKEKKPPALDQNNNQHQKNPSNFNQGHFGQSHSNFNNGNNFGNQNMLSTMTSIMANSNIRYGGNNNGPNGGNNNFNAENNKNIPNSGNDKNIPNGGNNKNIPNGGNNKNIPNGGNNNNFNSGNNNNNKFHSGNSHNNNFNSGNNNNNNFNNGNNNNNNFNSGNNKNNNFNNGNNNNNNFNNGNNNNNNFNNGNNNNNNFNNGNNNNNNFNGGNNNNNNFNGGNSNNNNFNGGNSNNFNNGNGNNNNFNNGNNNNNNFNNGNSNNGGSNNNFAAAASNHFPNSPNDGRRPGLGPIPTQIPHQTFQPPMPMPPSGIPTMGSILAPFSNMLTNTFGIGKHKQPPPPFNIPMMPPMMNPQQQQPPPPPRSPGHPHLPPPPTTKFPPPNKFNNINYHNNRFPPPPPPNNQMNNNQFNHPFQKPPHQSYRDGPPKGPPPNHPFNNRPMLMDGDPMHMVEQQSHSQLKNVPPMMPIPIPIRRPPQPQPPTPLKKKPLNDKEKIIEALETLNNVKYDEIESVAAEQFGPDLIERIKSKKKLSVSSTTTPRPRVPSTTTARPTQRPFPKSPSTTIKNPSVSDSSVQLASLISYVNKMKKDHEKLKNINQAVADAHSSESKHTYSKGQSPVASMSTDDISSLFASISSMERGSKTATKHHSSTTTTTPRPKPMKPALELPVFGPTSSSFSFGPSGGNGNDIKTLQSQLAKAILAKAARQQENKEISPSPTAPQKLIAAAPSHHNPLQAVVHLAALKGNSLGINSKNYTSAQIETLKKLIALNNIEKKLMQSHGFFNLSSAISGRGPQQSPWRPPQQPTPFHNKMLLDHSSSPGVNHLDFSSNSPVQNNPFSASANNNYNNKVTSHIKLLNSNNNNNNQFQNNFAAAVPSPSDPTLIALKALAMKKAQGINPQPNILLPQQTKPKEEKSAGGFQPIPVDLSAILSPSPPLEVAQPEGTNWQRRNRLTDIKNAPKSFYPGNASLEFDASSTTQMFTDFSCDDQKFFPGLYADTALSCKVFHLCAKTNTGYMMKTFRCPRETVFDQEVLRCNWNLYVDCNESQDKYHFNKYLSQSFQFLRILGEFSASYQKPNATVTG